MTAIGGSRARYGRIIQFDVGFKSTAALSDVNVIAKISNEADRPVYNAAVQEGDKYQATVDISGSIVVRRSIPSGVQFWLKTIYITRG